MDVKIIEKLERFYNKYPRKFFSKGEYLIKAGKEPSGIFYLRSGNVRQFVLNRNGNEISLNIYKPHTFFPMSYAVDAYKNNHYFIAMGDCEISIAPKKDILVFIKKEREIMFNLLKRLYIGMDGVLSRLEFLMSGNARQKLIAVLLISANRFGVNDRGNLSLNIKFTHQDLAYLSGLSRETVSREMMNLKQQKLINYSKRMFTFFDIKNLENELFG